MMAADRAPGLSRDYWGFEGCADFDADGFDDLLADADERFERGLEDAPQLFGFDIDSQAVGIARGNARRLGLSKLVTFGCADCADLPVSLHQNGIEFDQRGFIAINPPYGMRLLAHGLDGFYEHLSRGLRGLSDSWSMTVITPDDDFDGSVGFEAQRILSVYNGAIEATLRSYRLGHSSIIEVPLVTLEGTEVKVAVTSDHALQFAARLRKMAKARRKWARKNKVHAYRIYDADLPDYAVAVDVFEEQGSGDTNLLITEYQAPKEIDPAKATRRFKDACTVAPVLLGVPEERLFTQKADRNTTAKSISPIASSSRKRGIPSNSIFRAIWTRVCSSTIVLLAVWWAKWRLISASLTYLPTPARQRSMPRWVVLPRPLRSI